MIESGWLCPTPSTACHQPACGNGFIDFTAGGGAPGSNGSTGPGSGGVGGAGPSGTTEQCDDLNTISGDGCSAQCTIEPGFACEVPGVCHVAVCGDGVLDWPAEQCDDGIQIAHDGCYQCVYEYSGGNAGAGNPSGGAKALHLRVAVGTDGYAGLRGCRSSRVRRRARSLVFNRALLRGNSP